MRESDDERNDQRLTSDIRRSMSNIVRPPSEVGCPISDVEGRASIDVWFWRPDDGRWMSDVGPRTADVGRRTP